MLTYIIRRLLLMIPTLIGVTLMVFFIMANAPGGFADALNEGNQSMGDEARRLRQEVVNRYALDKPQYVQYLRWLNQVSPIGFEMTGDYEWPEQTQQSVLKELETRDWLKSQREREAARDLLLKIAAFADLPPEDVLAKFDEAAADPVAAVSESKTDKKIYYDGASFELFVLLDTMPLGELDFFAELNETAATDKARAVEMLFIELQFSSIGKSRIQYSQFKFWGPDLGKDKNGRDVGDLLIERLPITLLMNMISIPLIYIIAVISGVWAARKRGGVFDVASGTLMLGLYSVPAILAGTLMIGYLASAEYPMFRWFPASGVNALNADQMPFLPYMQDGELYRGWLFDRIWHLLLPVTCLTYAGFAFLSKVMRGSVLDTISADFVRTARAKGVAEQQILFRHVLRNSMLPLITMAASIIPAMFVGSFVVEYIFSIQGMGRLTIEAAKNADINIVMATTLVGAALMLASLLLRDICYAIADPRVTYD